MFASSGLLLVADRLWDGTGAGARSDMALVIRDGRVERVAPATECAGWVGPRLHAGGATVMPGLMDLHVHLVSVVDPDEPNAIWAEVSARTQLLTLHAAKNARLMLEAGFTTVRDVEGEPDRDVRVLQDPARLLVVMQEGRIVVDRRA